MARHSKRRHLETLAAHGAKFAHHGAPAEAVKALPGVVTARQYKPDPETPAETPRPTSKPTTRATRDMESHGYALE